MDGRRFLEFDRLDQVMPEVDRLLLGHETMGSWTLGQILDHLASSFRLTMVGDPRPTIEPLDPATARRFDDRRRRFFEEGRFPDGAKAPHPALDPPPDADDRISAKSLQTFLDRFGDYEGSFSIHPRLGPLSKEDWARFHRLHCAHHLGFARPTAANDTQAGPGIPGT